MKVFVCLTLACLTLMSAASFRQLQADPNAAPAPATEVPPPAPLPETPYLQVVQRVLNGLAEEAGVALADISVCLNETTASSYLRFASDVLRDLSRRDWIELPRTVENFRDESDAPEVCDCLSNDAGLRGIWNAYGIADLDLTNLYVKVSTYAIDGNYETLIQNVTDINTIFNRGQYEIAGRLTGQLINTVVHYDPNAAPAAPSTVMLSQMKNVLLNSRRYEEDYDDEDYNDYNGRNRDYDDEDEDEDEEYDDYNNNYNNYDNNDYQDSNNNYNNDQQDENGNNNYNNNDNQYQNENQSQQNNDQNDYNNNQGGQSQGADDYSGNDDNSGDDFGYGGYGGYGYGDPAPQFVYNIFEGLAELAKQSPPKSLRPCFDGQSGRITLNILLDTVGEVSNRGFDRLRPTVTGYLTAIPPSTLKCVANSKDFKNILTAYSIKEKTLQAFYQKIAEYGLTKDANKLAQASQQILIASDHEDFNGVGQNAGKLLKIVFKGNGDSQNQNQ